MKKNIMKLMAIILTVAMLCSMFPTFASAAKVEEKQTQEISAKSEAIINADIWDKIDSFEDENIVATRGKAVTVKNYAELSDEIEALVKQTDTYVEGSIVRNGDFFTWETTEGIVCGYSPELRFKTRNNAATGNDNTTVVDYATKAGPSDKDVFLIAPYYGYDSSFTNQYKNEASSIASATGGKYTLYEGTNATITNIANAFQNGGVVIFDSHGITDYQNGEDYVSRANSSYLCLKTSTGITSSDMSAVSGTYGTYYHAFNGGSSTYCVDGTAIKNHMSKAAPGTILWMAICLGMATSGLCTPMRNAGCEVVYGYSQSVSFTGDYKYETYFWNKMKAGSDVKTAASYMKSAAGSNWDPAYASYSQSQAKSYYVAFPIVVSDQDTYPGQGKVDAVQTVKSTYTLFGSSSGSSDGGSSGGSSGGSTGGSTTTSGDTYELVTAAADLTAGKYIILANADGSYAGSYNYYALTTAKDGSYAAMSAQGLSFDSLPTSLTCDASAAGDYVWTMSGSRTSMKLATGSNYLVSASGSTKLSLSTTATTWSASYSSSYQGFRVSGNSRYISLRDDISTVGDNGAPLFCTVSSTSSGTTYLHFYKLSSGSSSGSGSGSTTCTHPTTTSSTTNATCTASGKTTVTCKTCGAVVSTTTIPALGHSYKYTSNGNGTHKVTCARCTYSSTANCSFSNNVCNYCGYTNASSGNTSTGATGQFVIAAKVGSTYYAMSNSFASKISAAPITVTNGQVAAADAQGYVVNLTENGNYYTIDNGSKYLKYSSSTNFTTSSTAYNWQVIAGTHGTYRIVASSSTSRGIIYSTSAGKFGAYAVSNATASSSIYYDVEILPVVSSTGSGSGSGSNTGSDSGSTSGEYTYELVTSASALTAGDYIILAASTGSYGDYGYYALTTQKDGSYAAMSAQGLSFDSLPTALTCDPSSASAFEWTMTGSRTSMKLSSGSNYLAGASGSTKLTLATSATTWSATYTSSKQAFRVKGNSRYISLRDDISTVGDNNNPLFCTVSSTSSGATYLYFYKCTTTKVASDDTINTSELVIATKAAKTTRTGVDAKFTVDAAVCAKYDRVYAVVRVNGKEAVVEGVNGQFTYSLNIREKNLPVSITIYAEKDGITYVGATDTWNLADVASAR